MSNKEEINKESDNSKDTNEIYEKEVKHQTAFLNCYFVKCQQG